MLSQFLVTELFAFLLVFCRLGSAMMLLPGFGEAYVSVRVRLLLALMLTLTLAPALHKLLPPMPASIPALLVLMLGEILIGLFMGSLSRMLISALHVGAAVIAYIAGLSSALTQDITGFQGQDTSLGNMLSMAAIVLIFVTDLHYLMLRGLVDSYSLFTPGVFPPVADFANHTVHMMDSVFRMALQLATPNLVIGMVFYLGMGMIARLMPNIQIFFIMTAPQLMINLFIYMILIGAILTAYLGYFRDALGTFMAPQ